MTKKLNSIKATIILLALVVSIIACDKDYASIGVDVIGVNNFETSKNDYPVITYSDRVDPVKTKFNFKFVGYI